MKYRVYIEDREGYEIQTVSFHKSSDTASKAVSKLQKKYLYNPETGDYGLCAQRPDGSWPVVGGIYWEEVQYEKDNRMYLCGYYYMGHYVLNGSIWCYST